MSAHTQKDGSKTPFFAAGKDEMMKQKTKKISKQKIVQFFGRIVLPTITATFVLGYVVAATYLYRHPKLKYD